MNVEALRERLERLPGQDLNFAHNSLLRWAAAIALFLLAAALLRLVLAILKSRARRFDTADATAWWAGFPRLVTATRGWFLLATALYVGALALELPNTARNVVHSVAIVALLAQAALWGVVFLDFAVRRYSAQRLQDDAETATTISALNFLGKMGIWAIALLLALDNVGIDVTAMVAGLGIGGIAVALAAQNILGDLFASLSIVLDKPFVLGDSIAVGDFNGTVEKIGLRTTRLRSLSGEQLIFANNDLLQNRIRNYKRMFERRVLFVIGVVYETSPEKLRKIPELIRATIDAQPSVRFDRSHFRNFGDSALNFETVYFVLSPDYLQYMDIQQNVNLRLCEEFAREGIQFAYPTQRVLLEGVAPSP